MLGVSAAPAAAQDDNFTCRASLVRTSGFAVAALNQEPTVANRANNPCATDSTNVFEFLLGENEPILGDDNTLAVGPVTAKLLFAETTNNDDTNPATNNDNAAAESGVAQLTIAIPGAPVIRANVLTSTATAQCNGTNPPAFSGSSTIARLFIGDQEPLAPVTGPLNTPRVIEVPGTGIFIRINQTYTTAESVTQRALEVNTPVGNVVIAEAIADFRGNPCDDRTNGGTEVCNGLDDDNDGQIDEGLQNCPPPGKEICGNGIDDDNDGQIDENCPGGGGDRPDCSDEIDNDGDGKIDFPNDPGCESYQDDDETDGGDAPDCSDGEDNDGDGQIDYPEDPGCENRDDDDEENNDDPECSDGVDNDGDGTIDHPADTGCKSPEDDDEAAGFMTGGGGYDEIDKKTANEDLVEPGTFLRYGTVLPCDLGDRPGPNQTVTWHDPGNQGKWKLDTLTRAFCRNDPFIDPRNPNAEFDTYVGDGTGTFTPADTGVPVPAYARFHVIDRGEPGAPPVIGVDYFHIRVSMLPVLTPPMLGVGYGTLDHGNNQAHTPRGASSSGSGKRK